MKQRPVVLATFVAVILGGCGASAPPPAPGSAAALAVDPSGGRELQRRELEPMAKDLQRSLSVEKPLQVLALSGGGQWGAFGAGFLKGWTARGDRPEEFQIVTGTSSGSLISTFAFLGHSYDETVGQAYLGIRGDGDVMKKRFLLTAVFSDAMATTEPLRRLIESVVSDEVVAKVAIEAGKGRRLYVGAVDLDLGIFKPFDLTAIASRGGPQARKEFIDALMASTAIPVAFPPVVIDGRTYVDGGVRRNIFLEMVVKELGELRQRQLQRGLAPPPATVYCLVNGTLNVGTKQVKRRVLDIARRSVEVLLDESTDGNLLRVYLQAQKSDLRFLMTRIPATACNAVGSQENQFDPQLMRCLHQEGQVWAQRDDAWSPAPPLDREAP